MNGNDPAFPRTADGDPGLTKRELFAAMMMVGLLACDDVPFLKQDGTQCQTISENSAACAQVSVSYAEALIAQLSKK